jgi:hypothetical protein
MMSYFLSLPRASWKARAIAALVACFLVLQILQKWPHRHDGLAIARWIAWFMLLGDTWLLWMTGIVCVLGRMPRSWARGRGSLNRTLSQIHADIAGQMQEERDRSRWL